MKAIKPEIQSINGAERTLLVVDLEVVAVAVAILAVAIDYALVVLTDEAE